MAKPAKKLASKESSTKKIKKEKKVKDPNAPKKPLTSFLIFIKEKQKEFKEKHPSLAHKDVISKMGEAWKTMTEKDKKPFTDLALQDKGRFEKEKSEYEKKK